MYVDRGQPWVYAVGMNSVGELRKQSHNLKSIERVRLGSGVELVGFCECNHLSSGGDGPLPQVHSEILARHKAHVAEVAACANPDAATVEEPRLGLLGWICPDCGDEFRFPDTMEGTQGVTALFVGS